MPRVTDKRADDAVADGCSVPLAHVGERLAFTVCLAVRVGAAVERVASVADALNGCVAVAELTCHDEAVARVKARGGSCWGVEEAAEHEWLFEEHCPR